jgi:hypothetical protein
MAKTCRLDGCGEPVRGRRRYCSDEHAHEAKLAIQALNRLHHGEEYNEARRETRARENPYPEADERIVDYTIPGAASKPPSFDLHPKQVRREPEAVVDYTRGGHRPGEAPQKLDLSRIPASIRRDLVRAQQMAAAQMRREASEVIDWNDLQAAQHQADSGHVVDLVHLPPPPPQSRYDHLGRSIPRSRRWG